MENEIYHLKLEEIIPNKYQPREVLDEVSLNELTQSIKQHGVIQPIIVRKKDDKYEIIDGERRYKAAIKACLSKIPVIVRAYNDNECIRISLVDNLQRQDYSPIEEAKMYKKILENEGMTQEELANNIGKSQGAVANKLRLLNLPYEVQEALLKQEISERHARSLLKVKDTKIQIDLLRKIIEKRMTVRELDSEIKNMSNMFIPEEFRNNENNNQFYDDQESFITANNVINNNERTTNSFFTQPHNIVMEGNGFNSMNNNNIITDSNPFITPINDLSEFNIPLNDNQNNSINSFSNNSNIFIPKVDDNNLSTNQSNNPFLTSDSYIPPIVNNEQNTGNPFSNIRMNTTKNNNSPTLFFTENSDISNNNDINSNNDNVNEFNNDKIETSNENANYTSFNNKMNNNFMPMFNKEPLVSNNNINNNQESKSIVNQEVGVDKQENNNFIPINNVDNQIPSLNNKKEENIVNDNNVNNNINNNDENNDYNSINNDNINNNNNNNSTSNNDNYNENNLVDNTLSSEFEEHTSSFNIEDYMLPGFDNQEENNSNNNINNFYVPNEVDFTNLNPIDEVKNSPVNSEMDYKYVEENPNYVSVDNPKGVESIDDVINLLRDTLDKIKNGKLKVDTEEIDFDDLYQITIKIDKKGDF